jgi:hypothetical protein
VGHIDPNQAFFNRETDHVVAPTCHVASRTSHVAARTRLVAARTYLVAARTSFVVATTKPVAARTLSSFDLEDGTEKPNHRNSVAPQSSAGQFVAGQRLGSRHFSQNAIDIYQLATLGALFQPAQPFQSGKFLTHGAGHQLVDGNTLFPSQPFGVGAKIIG